MKASKNLFKLFIIGMCIILCVIPFNNSQGTTTNPIETNTATPNVIHTGADALDWTLEEIISDTYKTFSSFAGKVIVMDFFATWCGPCQEAMPHLRNINDHYAGNESFLMMSIGVDLSEDESLLENFSEDYNMNWFIFRDTVDMSTYYNIEFIPTLIIVNQYQYVYYTEIGFESEETIINIVDSLMAMDDNSAPIISDFDADKSSISILENSITVSAQITDESLRFVSYNLTIGSFSEVKNFWAPTSGTFVYKFTIDPEIIWDETQAGTNTSIISLLVGDFVGYSASDQLEIVVDNTEDTEEPEIIVDALAETEGFFGQDFDITVTVTDDTLVTQVKTEIWINEELNVSLEMDAKGGDIYQIKFFNIKVNPGQAMVFKIIAKDISEKITTLLHNYTTIIPTTPNTSTTVNAAIALGSFISFMIAAEAIINRIKKVHM